MTSNRRSALVGGGAAVLAAAVAGAALASSRGGSPAAYRTTTVAKGDVSQTLHRSGTIEPVAQASVAFPISGTVAGLDVKLGDTVSTGQTLAHLDTTALEGQLAAKRATFASAEFTLQRALNPVPTVSTVSSGNAARALTTTTSRPSGSTAGGRGGSGNSGGQSPSQQVATQTQRVDDALAQAASSLQAANDACGTGAGALGSGGSGTSSSTTSTTSTTSTMGPGSTTSTTTGGRQSSGGGGTSGSDDACSRAEAQALRDQRAVASAERALSDAEAARSQELASASSSPSNASPARTTATTSATRPSTGTVTAASAEELVADQAAVDAAAADVALAEQNVAQATIVSPISGNVAAVGLAVGRQVAASSFNAAVVVVGQGGYEVATTVAATDIAQVRVHGKATVVPDGTSSPIDAEVVSIGVTASTNGATTTFPVVLGFAGTPSGLRNGASASVDLEVARSIQAVTVPTSAVHALTASLSVVRVLAGGKTSIVPVRTGTMGAERTEVLSGLAVGQVVVLADLRLAIPSSTAGNRIGATLGGGGLGGTGGAGGFRPLGG